MLHAEAAQAVADRFSVRLPERGGDVRRMPLGGRGEIGQRDGLLIARAQKLVCPANGRADVRFVREPFETQGGTLAWLSGRSSFPGRRW